VWASSQRDMNADHLCITIQMSDDTSITPAIAGASGGLPDPYGVGFEESVSQLELTKEEWERIERIRIRVGALVSNPFFVAFQNISGVLIALVALSGVIAPTVVSPLMGFAFIIFIPIFIVALAPSFIAAESSWRAFSLRTSLWEQGGMRGGKRTGLKSRPGMDRIAEGLRDGRRNNGFAITMASISMLLFFFSVGLSTDGIAYNLALLIVMTTGLGFSFHAIFTNEYRKRYGDFLPYLMLHSPTHRPTQLNTILGDLVVAHLDPDSELDWRDWEGRLESSLLSGVRPLQARERMLYLLYLHQIGTLDTQEAIRELQQSIRSRSLADLLLDENAIFNWRTLQRVVSHAKAWQPEVFQLLDRLQSDLMVCSPSTSKGGWRMDLALDNVHEGGTGHLFIALNNQTKKTQHVRVEVIIPGGEPESRDHRLEIQSCIGPKSPLPLTDPLKKDVLDYIPQYLEKGAILWLGVAWKRGFKGQKVVQVILKDDDGTVFKSRVINAHDAMNEAQLERMRTRRIHLARAIGEMALPTATSPNS
jgi:hypothetical protein